MSVSDFRYRCAYVVDVANFSPVLRETVTVVPLYNFSGLDI